MKNKLMLILKKGLKILFILIATIAVLRFAQVFYDSYAFSDERAPYLQTMTTSSVIIKWQTKEKTHGIVSYGNNVQQLNQQVGSSTPSQQHEVTITGLKPDTQYFYAVDNHYKKSPQRWFKTLAIKPKAVRIWALGDSGKSGENQQAVKRSALQWMEENRKDADQNSIDLWLLLGDIAYSSGSQKNFQKALFDAYPNVIKQNPIWPVYGNHDDRRWAYFDIFSLPEQGESGGVASGTEHYYAIDFGNVHVLMLDTQDSSLEADGEMAQWIKKDLAATKAQWIITVLHHPPYSDGGHNSDDDGDSGGRLVDVRNNIVPILEQGGVDLVLAGHSHGYERSDLMRCQYANSEYFDEGKNTLPSEKPNHYKKDGQGTLYVVSGSASKLDQADYNHPALPHSHAELGSVIIDIKGSLLTGHFINDQAIEVDFFQLDKTISNPTKTLCND